jgi:hypothetical protein
MTANQRQGFLDSRASYGIVYLIVDSLRPVRRIEVSAAGLKHIKPCNSAEMPERDGIIKAQHCHRESLQVAEEVKMSYCYTTGLPANSSSSERYSCAEEFATFSRVSADFSSSSSIRPRKTSGSTLNSPASGRTLITPLR